MKAPTAENTPLSGTGRTGTRRGGQWGFLLLLLLLVGALAAFAGWMLVKGSASAIPGFAHTPEPRAIATLPGGRESIGTIRIEGQGQNVTLRQGGKSWQLASNSGYPVLEPRVNAFLDTVERLRATYVSEQSPPPYESMGLTGLDDPAGPTTRVTIADKEGARLASFTVGTSITAPGGTLQPMTAVMLPGDSRIWLVEGNIQFQGEAVRWVDNRISNVPPGQLDSLTITGPDGTRLAMQRGSEGQGLVVTEGLAAGERIRATWVPRELAGALAELTFLDVQPAEGFDMSENAWKAEINTTEGITYHATLQREDMGAWAMFRAEAKTEDAKAPAERFNARHGGWAYLLNQYAARRLTTRPQDLIQAE